MSDVINYARHDRVALIALNRPDSLNAFTSELTLGLLAALARAREDDDVRAIVLTGEGRCFSAGADLREFELDRTVEAILQNEYRPVQELIASVPKPVIAAVPGSVAGIGLSIALQCDLLIMADNAFMSAPFTAISLLPDGGLNWILVRQLGYRRAFEFCAESERIPASRCVEYGLANRAVPADELRDAALDWARSLSRLAPLALAATKKAMRYAADHDWAGSFELETRLQGALFGTEDNREGIAAFLEKRSPEFKGK